jgi:hypothetical protein
MAPMNILLKWKIWRIKTTLRNLLRKTGIEPYVWSFGAYYINPRHLVIVAGVQTDNEKEKLKADLGFKNKMRELLKKFNWPEEARNHVVFDIESQETVDRESNGRWFFHYK